MTQDSDSFSRRALFPWLREYHRGTRGEYLAAKMNDYVADGTILDVGAGTMAAKLRKQFGSRYTAVDFAGSYNGFDSTADFVVEHNLNAGTLPFPDASFDTVLCMDVLEHVDDPYSLLRDIQRVAAKRAIISLPNNWVGYLKSFLAGTNITHRAGYGLPAEPHAPGQRHKWFFNATEAVDFIVGNVASEFHPGEIRLVFTPGTDALVFGWPVIGKLARNSLLAKRETFKKVFGVAGAPAYIAARAFGHAVYALDLPLALLWFGWRNPKVLYNLLCRQVWVVISRKPSPNHAS